MQTVTALGGKIQHLCSPLSSLPHPHRTPHAAFITIVGFHLQHMGAAGFSVQSPEAPGQQPGLSVYAEQFVAVV